MSEEWGRSDVPLVVFDAIMPGQVLKINRFKANHLAAPMQLLRA